MVRNKQVHHPKAHAAKPTPPGQARSREACEHQAGGLHTSPEGNGEHGRLLGWECEAKVRQDDPSDPVTERKATGLTRQGG